MKTQLLRCGSWCALGSPPAVVACSSSLFWPCLVSPSLSGRGLLRRPVSVQVGLVFSFLCLFSSVLACSAGPYTSITMSGLVFAADPRDSVAWASCCDLPSMWLFFRQLYSMSRQHMRFVSRALRFRLINSRAGTDWWLKRKHESGSVHT